MFWHDAGIAWGDWQEQSWQEQPQWQEQSWQEQSCANPLQEQPQWLPVACTESDSGRSGHQLLEQLLSESQVACTERETQVACTEREVAAPGPSALEASSSLDRWNTLTTGLMICMELRNVTVWLAAPGLYDTEISSMRMPIALKRIVQMYLPQYVWGLPFEWSSPTRGRIVRDVIAYCTACASSWVARRAYVDLLHELSNGDELFMSQLLQSFRKVSAHQANAFTSKNSKRSLRQRTKSKR
jgi:hypothetical protein